MRRFFYAAFLAVMMLSSCGSTAKTNDKTTISENLPQILRNHPDLASFTKLQVAEPEQIQLFNGRDFTGFYTWDEKNGKNNDLDHQFSVEDGMIKIVGENGAVLMTEKSYQDFYLRAQVKWGETSYGVWKERAKNGGLEFACPEDAEDKKWPTSIQYQVAVGNIGDAWSSFPVKTEQDTVFANERYKIFGRKPQVEKPYNEWNLLELITVDDKVETYLNGEKMVSFTLLEGGVKGRIYIQYEYTDVYYKDLVLIPLK